MWRINIQRNANATVFCVLSPCVCLFVYHSLLYVIFIIYGNAISVSDAHDAHGRDELAGTRGGGGGAAARSMRAARVFSMSSRVEERTNNVLPVRRTLRVVFELCERGASPSAKQAPTQSHQLTSHVAERVRERNSPQCKYVSVSTPRCSASAPVLTSTFTTQFTKYSSHPSENLSYYPEI